MKKPQSFLSACGVLNRSVMISGVCNMAIAFFSCVQYGSETAESATLNVTGWYGVLLYVIVNREGFNFK